MKKYINTVCLEDFCGNMNSDSCWVDIYKFENNEHLLIVNAGLQYQNNWLPKAGYNYKISKQQYDRLLKNATNGDPESEFDFAWLNKITNKELTKKEYNNYSF